MNSALKENHRRSTSPFRPPPTWQGIVESQKEEGLGRSEGVVPGGKE